METDGIKQSLVMSNILLGMCKKANRIDKTLKTLNDKSSVHHENVEFISLINDLVSLHSIPFSYTFINNTSTQEKSRKIEAADEILTTIRKSGHKPNLVTYNSLLMVFGRSGKLRESILILQKMRGDGISPDIITYNALIGTFCGAGRINDAVSLFECIPSLHHPFYLHPLISFSFLLFIYFLNL